MAGTPSSVDLADTVSDLLYGVAGWLLVGLGLVAFAAGLGGLVQQAGTPEMVVPLLVLAFGFVFVVAGVFVNPRFRRRLDRRHAPTRFGRVESVDSRVMRAAENRRETCVGCGDRVEEGLLRRYRSEYALAGVPVWTRSEAENVYCSRCAVAERTGTRLPDRDPTPDEKLVTETE